MKKLPLWFAAVAFFACNQPNKKDKPIVGSTTVPVEHINPTPDQQTRREQSEKICKAHNVPIYTNPNALFEDAEAKVFIRPKDSVAGRALALFYIGLKSEGLDQKILDKINKEYHISSKLSPQERAYATALQPTEQQKVDANWRYECFHVMLWALGFVDSLNYPSTVCNVAADTRIIHELNEAQFKEKAKLRSKKDILDAADLILRLDWACTNARINGQPMPGNLNQDVVTERHRALNWLIYYAGEDWDDVTMDT